MGRFFFLYVWTLLSKIDFSFTIDSNLKLWYVAFDSKSNFYT